MKPVTNIAEAIKAISEGKTSFMGLDFFTASDVLVPREETELVTTLALETINSTPSSLINCTKVIDMCCGAGNIACTIAVNIPSVKIWASDLTQSCYNLTKRNVEHHSLCDRVSCFQGDLFEPLSGLGLEGNIDMIICNPPYISQSKLEADNKELLNSEPREAFDGGPYGLTIHQRVCKEATKWLKPHGWLLFEFGSGQHKQLQFVFKRAKVYSEVEFKNDKNGDPRAARARKDL